MAQNQKLKVKEFQWFQMETKVRQIIQEIVTPLQKRVIQNSNTIGKLKSNQTEDQKKINQITLMIANDPTVFETGIFLTVDLKFEEHAKMMQELSRQIKEENKYVDDKFAILDVRMQESSQVLKNVASLRERISRQMELQNDNINSLRKNIEEMISHLNASIRQTRAIQQSNLQSCQKEQFLLNDKVKQISLQISNINETLTQNKEKHREQTRRLDNHDQTLAKHLQNLQQLQQSKALTRKLNDFVKNMQNQLKKVEFKLDNISPLITQAQISDCLYYVLPKKMKARIAVHEHKKYYDLNREVLTKQFQEVSSHFQSFGLLEEMQKRNTKQIVQMKRKKILSMGIDVDHLTYEQRERYYQEVVIDDGLDNEEETEQVKVSNKMDERDIIKVVKDYFGDFIQNTSQKIQTELGDNKKYIYGLEEELRHEMTQIQAVYSKKYSECEAFHVSQMLECKNIEQKHADLMKQIEKISDNSFRDKAFKKMLYNFCSLLNHMLIQDEIDKQNISLMGVKENGQQPSRNSIVEVDKKCFSCCGYPASALSAFKMACLAYNPSPIKIDSKEYKREQLLQFTTSMLHTLKNHLQEDGNQAYKFTSNYHFQMENCSSLENSRKLQHNKTFNEESNNKKIFTEGESVNDLKQVSGVASTKTSNRFRFMKKSLNSIRYPEKNQSSSKPSQRSSKHEEMSNISLVFNELKKRHLC